jgi:lysozyme
MCRKKQAAAERGKAHMNREQLLIELRRDEGEKLVAYLDSEGYWTIGVGHLIDPKRGADPAPFGINLVGGGSITSAQSRQLLDQDVSTVERELDEQLPWWRDLSEVRQRVLANMAFNMGLPTLKTFRNTLGAMEEGRYSDAAAGMLKSRWAVQVGNRAKRLALMMETGEA